MSGAPFMPDDPGILVGNCASCRLAKIGELQDINDNTQYHPPPTGTG